MVGNNAAVTDIELLNSFNAISAVQAHRHYIARIQGQVCFGLLLASVRHATRYMQRHHYFTVIFHKRVQF